MTRKKETTYPVVVETFRKLGDYEIRAMTSPCPSVFNGVVRVHRYRVTVERVEESPEVLWARLQDLWDASTNYHDADPLRSAAKKLGYEIQGQRGAKARERGNVQ